MLPKILLGLGLFATMFSVLIFSGKINIGKKAECYSRKYFEECKTANMLFVAQYAQSVSAC
jgi:hypothetical protein